MKTKLTKMNFKSSLGARSTKVGILTLALVAAPAVGAGAFAASSAFDWEHSPCVVAQRMDDPSIFATRGYCENVELPNATNPSPETGNGGSGSEVTPPPTGGSNPPPSDPALPSVGRETITDVELYSSTPREIVLLNNGGFLEVVGDKKVFITPSRGAEAREIVGYPASMTVDWRRLDANASPDGKTIVIYNVQNAIVSFDGGATWSPQKLAQWYDAEHQYLTSDVSADGKVVVLSQGKLGGSGFFTWLNSDSGRQISDWKSTGMYQEYSIDVSGDGSMLSSSIYASVFPGQTMRDLNATPYPKATTVNLYGYEWYRDFAASSDFQKQLRAMRQGSEGVNYLFSSNDGGVTMTKKMVGKFWSVGVSDNGMIQSALRTHDPDNEVGQLYMSFDGGDNWKKMDVLNGAELGSAELAPDGKTVKLITPDSKTYFATVNP